MHANIDVHIRILIAVFPKERIKCIETLQSHFANMTFSEKEDMTGIFSKSHIKEGNQQSIKLEYFRMHMFYQFPTETDKTCAF